MPFEEVNPEQAIADVQKRLQDAQELLNTVQIRKYELKKELVEIQEACRKAEYTLSCLKLEEKIKTREFWRSRDK